MISDGDCGKIGGIRTGRGTEVLGENLLHRHFTSSSIFFFSIWFVRLLALRPLWPIVPASGDSEDDYGEADGM
jgi:hypothetical protein